MLATYINAINVHPVTQYFEATLSLGALCDLRGRKYISSFSNAQTAVLVAYFNRFALHHAPVYTRTNRNWSQGKTRCTVSDVQPTELYLFISYHPYK